MTKANKHADHKRLFYCCFYLFLFENSNSVWKRNNSYLDGFVDTLIYNAQSNISQHGLGLEQYYNKFLQTQRQFVNAVISNNEEYSLAF